LLDNQSSVHIMCYPDFVDTVWEASQQMVLKSNGGKLPINEVADFEGFKRETWFSRNAMTKILSFSLVKSEYDITYDGDAFIIHRATKGYSDMVFESHKCGLHVYDPDDPRGCYSFTETVEKNVIEIPKQIMSGEVVHYKFYAMGFGWYCQIHEEDHPRNGMVQQTQGSISLGPSGNAQRGHKFFTLTTGEVVIHWAWRELPTSVAVIERVALLAKGMPALPIFTGRAGCVIGDVENVYLHNIEHEADKALVDNSILPGVHTAEADDEIPGVDMVHEQDVDVDLDFAPADGGNAEPPLDDAKEHVIIWITGVIVDWLVKVAPKVCASYVATNSKGVNSLLVECYNAIYGTMVAGLLYHRKFSSSMKNRGFTVNPYDSCVWNSGSGMMKVAQGKIHKYLGMMLDFTTSKIVKVTMLEYVDEIIGSWDKVCNELGDGYKAVSGRKKIATAAPDDLFKIDDDVMKLDQARAKAFHNITAKGIYVNKKTRPDISLSIAFLTTRVKGPDIDDWRKLCHLVEYLRSTRGLPLILAADSTGVLSWYFDASFAMHPDMRGHTGGAITMGMGFPDKA
jgi:hypothetical protein